MKHLIRENPNLHKQYKNDDLEKDYQEFSSKNIEELFQFFQSREKGLSEEAAAKILAQNGTNTTTDKTSIPWFHFLLKAFIDEFIIVLVIIGVVSFFLNDRLGALIIFILVIISSMIRFSQDYSAYRSSEKLKKMLHTSVYVRRDGEIKKVNVETIVVGDIVELGSGSIIPADLRILQSKDLFISQSVFTGESVPVEKHTQETESGKNSVELNNICLMGTNVVNGSGVGLVVQTGKQTYLGHISGIAQETKEKTNFEKGLSQVTNVLIKYIIFVVIGVFFINGFIKKDWLAAFMFAISVAVGITPGMLPMIINSALAKGSIFLAKKKTIVKNIRSIQNLGAIDTLCTDKTGTLTMDDITLQKYINANGEEEREILDFAFINSYYSTGIKNLIDRAIISYGSLHNVKEEIKSYQKVDEIPFDYERKRMSVVVKDNSGQFRIITKGAIEEILKISTSVQYIHEVSPITDETKEKIMQQSNRLNNEGMHVIAIAEKKEYAGVNVFSKEDETDMTFIGFVGFLDPPKPDVKEAIENLYHAGVDVKVLTGDSPIVATYICKQVGMKFSKVLLGTEIEKMTDPELQQQVEQHAIFARLAPMQKQRVINALHSNGHVVGYLGDGVNDAPSLRVADVGISVDSATDIAKESSDIILLEKSLSVLKDGIMEGRKIYGNMMKYLKMAISSNFGNVFSMLVGSIFLPFLPMLPIQILISNLIYDLSQIAIPWDHVDKSFISKPKKWNMKGLIHFINTMGITSSIYDVITFLSLWFILGYNMTSKQSLFQTGWFIESLISQTLIVHFIRTSKIAFIQSRANIRLILSTTLSILAALLVPIILNKVTGFNFEVMPNEFFVFLIIIIFSYAVTIEIVKKIYIKVYHEWL